jgi:hypothetical protein
MCAHRRSNNMRLNSLLCRYPIRRFDFATFRVHTRRREIFRTGCKKASVRWKSIHLWSGVHLGEATIHVPSPVHLVACFTAANRFEPQRGHHQTFFFPFPFHQHLRLSKSLWPYRRYSRTSLIPSVAAATGTPTDQEMQEPCLYHWLTRVQAP